MKQAQNLTAGTIIPGNLCWLSTIRPVRIPKIIGYLSQYRALIFTLATILLISAIFLSGSYLFFVQLSTHGW